MSKGDFDEDAERAKRLAKENSWSAKRKQNLKRLGLWEKYGNGNQ